MIKSLQKRFVLTAMTAITLLIVILLTAINVSNIVISKTDSEKTLSVLAQNSLFINTGSGLPIDKPGFQNNLNDGFFDGNEIRFMNLPHFTVKADLNNNIIFTDISRIASVDVETAENLAKQVIEQGQPSGKIEKYRYLILEHPAFSEISITFLDTTNEIYSYIRVLLLSGFLGFICWGFMLFVVIALSKRAITPIAENIEKQKEFITNAGHEIKTPLAIIRSNAEAMELIEGENKWIKNIKEQTVRLDGLVKGMLFLAKSDENAIKISRTEFSLSELAENSIAAFNESFIGKNISLKKDIEKDLLVLADKDQIIQLFSIFLDNALKYTNENGFVTVNLKKYQSKTILTFLNSCENLPNIKPEQLFERFYRGDKSRNQKGGYGIGLSMAKTIADVNNLKISAEFKNEKTILFTIVF